MNDSRGREIAAFLSGCWADAIKGYLDTHPSKGHHQFTNVRGKNDGPPITSEQLVEEARKAASRFSQGRGDRTGKVLWIWYQLDRYARAIDVLMQLQPTVAPAVWAPMRLILQVVTDKEKASQIALDGIHHLAWHLDKWEDLATIFSKEEKVREAVVHLYEPILEFLASATQHLTQHSFKRAWRSFWASPRTPRDNLEDKLHKLEAAAESLDLVVKTVDHREQARHRAMVERDLASIQELLKDVVMRGLDSLAKKILNGFIGFPVTQELPKELSAQRLRELQMAISRCVENSHQEVSKSNEVIEWLATGWRSLAIGDTFHPIDGTGQWFFDCKQFTQWLADDSRRLLWVHGKPGSGKSHLSRIIVKHLTAKQRGPVLQCSFHGGSSKPRTSNPSSFAASILYQILDSASKSKCLSSVFSDLAALKKLYPAGPGECPWRSLWPLCRKALESQHAPSYYLVIDALDECFLYDQGSEPLNLKTILKEVSRTSAFRTVILARPHSDFSDFTQKSLRISIDQGLNANDIQLFASERFQDYDIPSAFKDSVLETIGKRAEGMFLWARECLEYLDNLACEDNILLERLQGCPIGLGPMYDKMTRLTASHLDHENRVLRQEVFGLVYEAQEPLGLDDISRILRLGKFDSEKFVLKIGRPLIEVNDKKVTFMHMSVRDWLSDKSRVPIEEPSQTLFIRPVDSHMRLVKQCLICLLDPQYDSPGRIGQLIHNNFGTSKKDLSVQDARPQQNGISFDYASKYWDFHLTAISDPELDVLDLAQKFLHQFQFAYWVEYTLFSRKHDFSKIRNAYVNLQTWHSQLPDEKKSLIKVDAYFSDPYKRLSDAYGETRSEDQLLQWLTLLRLARYFWDIGMAEKAIPLLDEVVKGLREQLGSQAPLTLKARREKALMYLEQNRPQEANSEFVDIVKIQKDRLGPDDADLYYTLHCKGETELLLNRYEDCLSTQREAAWGFLRLSDPDDSRYLSTQVWIALSLIELGDLPQALTVLTTVLENRKGRYGTKDIFAAAVQYSIGDIQRKQGKRQESLTNLKEALSVKRLISPLSSIWSMDIAISLLIAYRDFAMIPEALSILKDLDTEGHLDLLFDRYCQTTHIRGLLLSDQKQKNEAISLLQNLLIQTDRNKYNRALLWIILDLAIMLRARGKDGDKKQAEANFNHIIVDLKREESREILGDPEPDPPRLLRFAETALTFVRNRKFEEVTELFKTEKLAWYRPDDLWLSFGGPSADTAWMRGPLESPSKR